MIKIKGLTKSFDDLQVLKGIDIDIPHGMIYGLVGRSGAGKSTLLRCINGLETFDQGSLFVDGVSVKSLSRKDIREFRKNIGMISQQFSLLNRLSVYENIALPLGCWKYSNSYIDHKVKELLEMIGIPDKINAKPSELSGGQKQRVAIARVLAMNPKLLLCDEATSALDPKTAKSIIALLNQINHDLGITIVIVTHQMMPADMLIMRKCFWARKMKFLLQVNYPRNYPSFRRWVVLLSLSVFLFMVHFIIGLLLAFLNVKVLTYCKQGLY